MTSARSSKSSFALGEQPEWAGTEAVDETVDAVSFISTLLQEDPSESLLRRGYCIVSVDDEYLQLSSAFHSTFEEFCALPEEEKHKFAFLQFDPNTHSPNQYHGFSTVDGLKEQFMVIIVLLYTQKLQDEDWRWKLPRTSNPTASWKFRNTALRKSRPPLSQACTWCYGINIPTTRKRG
jgi:hypothetical protein